MSKEQSGLNLLKRYNDYLEDFNPIRSIGTISRIRGILLESKGPEMFVGELARIESNGETFLAEATAMHGITNNLMAYEETGHIDIGAKVTALGKGLTVMAGPSLLGRVLDGLGRPIDDKGPIVPVAMQAISNDVVDPMQRPPIEQQIQTGVRVIDGLLPIGKGQRVGIFAGSGVGKSSLLGMIARNSGADVNIIALIGERGREVREFIEKELGEEGLKRSIVVVSTSDKPALARVRGAYVANALAEYFRDLGQDVMLLFDSVTRFAMSQREIGLANGEPPASRGYTPSVFSLLPKILEKSGNSPKGSITGIYTVLVEGDDLEEPISDTVRGILDGHIVLSRSLAEQYHFPAIDVLKSISRLAPRLQPKEVRMRTAHLRQLLAAYRDAEDLIRVGAYVRGSDPIIDEGLHKKAEIDKFMQQDIDEKSTIDKALASLARLSVS
ncbi:MAG: FliI/YscN family ATPase [Spirochaetaceae bacterium]|nr:FliI/YscN family ATPase [Spirochaetaceae bacterium]